MIKNLSIPTFSIKQLVPQKTVLALLVFLFLFNTGKAQLTYTFTTAGATGQSGPSQTQVTTAYSSSNLNGLVTCTGGIQYFTIPSGVSLIRIDSYGAQGGSGGGAGGLGARMMGDFTVTPGQILKILVGQAGQNGTNHGGGGGASYVAIGSNTALCVAGGGGGSYYSSYSAGAANMAGTVSTTGNSGMHGANSTVNALGGSSGAGGNVGTLNTNSQGSGGGGFTGNGANGFGTTGGLSFINGGTGGNSANNSPGSAGNGGFGGGGGADWNSWAGAGGGGGYSGGGAAVYYGCGGGGGSYNVGANQNNSSGVNSGDGKVIITQLFVVNISQTSSVLCNGGTTGALSTTVVGSTGPYTYSWMPSGGTSSTTSGLSAGTYSCRVTSATSETTMGTFTISQPSAITSSVVSQSSVLCNAGSNGAAGISASGGTGSYTYSWTPSGGSSSSASGLLANTYTCTIKDANNCIKTETVLIPQPSALAAINSQTNVLCNGGTGRGAVSASGGVGGYAYAWSPSGGSGATSSGISAGNYTCTITDANSCTLVRTFTITQPTVLTASIFSFSVACNGAATGSLGLLASGGTGAYSYSWSPAAGTASMASNLAAGNYTGYVTDANGCLATQTGTIVQPTALNSIALQTNVACYGAASGAILMSVNGGAGAYTYSWSPSGGTNILANTLTAGNYSCVITDANLCTLLKTYTVTQPSAISPTLNSTADVKCNGTATGSLSIVASGGTGALTYLWSSGGGTNTSASALSAGVYSCTITDANNCSVIFSTTITQPSALSSVNTTTNVICNGSNNGSAQVTVSGGVTPYTYNWSGGGTASTKGNLIAGTYTCVVLDSNLCSFIVTLTITQPAAITASQTVNLCAGKTLTVGASVYSVGGVYTNTLTTSNGCDSTLTTNLTIYSLTAVSFSLNGKDTLCSGESPLLLTGGMPAGGTYTGSAVSSGNFDPALSTLGWNSISYTYIDQNQCSNKANDSLFVSVCTGIAKSNLSKIISVFPNPSSGLITISMENADPAEIKVYNSLGQLVVSHFFEAKSFDLDIHQHDSGLYIMTIKTKSGTSATRLIKE